MQQSAQGNPRSAEVDDLTLAQRVGAGDNAAFELLMRRHNRRLYRVARSVLRNAAEAEEALQEAYLCAYRALPSFRGESSLATWLSRVVVNECTSRVRRQARRDNIVSIVSAQAMPQQEGKEVPMEDLVTDNEGPDQLLARAELRALLERKIDELPEAYRTVFVLRGVEELSVEETAACLQIPEATVRTRHFRARSLLRESLAQSLDLAERDVFSFDGPRCDRIVEGVLARINGGE